jgi:ankyrin repeat protein
MTTRALYHALGVYNALQNYQYQDLEELNPKYIPLPQMVNKCIKGLLTIDSTTEIITIVDNEFAKYLQQDTDKFLSTGNSMFAKITLAYLLLKAFSSGPCISDALHLRLEEYVFLDYASRHWGFHTRQTLSNLGHESRSRSPQLSPDEGEIISKVVRLLGRRKNLESLLQVLNPGSQGPRLSTISILQVATRHGLDKVVTGLLQKSPLRVLDVDSNGTTALHEAAQAGWVDLVNMLLKADAQTWPLDKQEKSPWYYAAKKRHSDIMSCLQASKAFLDHTPGLGIGRESTLVIAIYSGYQDILRMYLDAGESPSSPEGSQSDLIPLHQAIRYNRLDLAAILLTHSADIQTRDNLQRNALFEIFGSRPFNTSGASLLLEEDINTSLRDHNGNTILHEAARLGSHEHFELFMNRGLGLRVFNTEGLSPLHLAAQHGHYSILDASLKRVDCIDVVDLVDRKLGWTSLMYSASAGHVQCCDRLIQSGANIEATSHNQETAMMLAISANCEDVKDLLHRKGARVKTKIHKRLPSFRPDRR